MCPGHITALNVGAHTVRKDHLTHEEVCRVPAVILCVFSYLFDPFDYTDSACPLMAVLPEREHVSCESCKLGSGMIRSVSCILRGLLKVFWRNDCRLSVFHVQTDPETMTDLAALFCLAEAVSLDLSVRQAEEAPCSSPGNRSVPDRSLQDSLAGRNPLFRGSL